MKFLKGMALFAAGVVTATSVSVMAEQATRNISVSYRNIKIYADGNLVNTSGANEAFIYNGTTYLPVRAVGEAFNKAVDWDAANSAVYLGRRPSGSVSPTVLLEDLDYFTKTAFIGTESSGSKKLYDDGKDNLGNVHNSGMYLGYGTVQYLLNGQYSRFKGTVGISYSKRNTSSKNRFKICGDGKLLYSSSIMTGGVMPENFDIDISGVLNLTLEAESGDPRLQIYDAGFYS